MKIKHGDATSSVVATNSYPFTAITLLSFFTSPRRKKTTGIHKFLFKTEECLSFPFYAPEFCPFRC
jgi:hypothetical protein